MNTAYNGHYLNEAKAKLIPFKELVLMNLYYTMYFGENDERALNEFVKIWWLWMENPSETPKKCAKCIRKVEILFPIILNLRKDEFINE